MSINYDKLEEVLEKTTDQQIIIEPKRPYILIFTLRTVRYKTSIRLDSVMKVDYMDATGHTVYETQYTSQKNAAKEMTDWLRERPDIIN